MSDPNRSGPGVDLPRSQRRRPDHAGLPLARRRPRAPLHRTARARRRTRRLRLRPGTATARPPRADHRRTDGGRGEHPAPDDQLLTAQQARLQRRVHNARAERGRVADLYQAGVIDHAEMTRRSREIDAGAHHLEQEHQTLIARQSELATGNRLNASIATFAQRAVNGIDTLDFQGRQQLLRLMLEDVRVHGWNVELRLRIPLDDTPPTDTASASLADKHRHARSPRNSRTPKEAVSSIDRLRSTREHAKHLPHRRGQRRTRHHELHRPEQPIPAPVRDGQRDRGLADIHGNDDRGRRDWGSTHRHNPPPVSVRRIPAR
jgi:hypothetical protein